MRIEGKRMLITGGTRGIGYSLADAAKRKGAEVLICGRDEGRLAAAKARLGVHGVCCDLGAPAELPALLAAVDETMGGLDVLVHNAGIQRCLDLADRHSEHPEVGLARELEVNLRGPVQLTSIALPRLREAAASGAAVVFVTSALALAPRPSAPIYCASKAGLRSFAKSLRHQLRRHGIGVLEVVPPVVDTAMTAERDEAKVSPESVAEEILAALRAGRDEVRIGKARFLFPLHRLAPRLAERLLAAR